MEIEYPSHKDFNPSAKFYYETRHLFYGGGNAGFHGYPTSIYMHGLEGFEIYTSWAE